MRVEDYVSPIFFGEKRLFFWFLDTLHFLVVFCIFYNLYGPVDSTKEFRIHSLSVPAPISLKFSQFFQKIYQKYTYFRKQKFMIPHTIL